MRMTQTHPSIHSAAAALRGRRKRRARRGGSKDWVGSLGQLHRGAGFGPLFIGRMGKEWIRMYCSVVSKLHTNHQKC